MSGNGQEPSFYEIEREKLISDVSESLAKAISSMNNLNRKMEANVAVGTDFSAASILWKEYERVMANTSEEPLPSKVEQVSITLKGTEPRQAGQDDVSFGLAPGAGSTSYLGR